MGISLSLLNQYDQVVQYCNWKVSELRGTEVKVGSHKVEQLSKSQENQIKSHKVLFLKDYHPAETILRPLSCDSSMDQHFDWADFSIAIVLWEGYACKLHHQIIRSLEHWKSHQSMFTISFDWNGSLVCPLEVRFWCLFNTNIWTCEISLYRKQNQSYTGVISLHIYTFKV